jgi:hypothetical protein
MFDVPCSTPLCQVVYVSDDECMYLMDNVERDFQTKSIRYFD